MEKLLSFILSLLTGKQIKVKRRQRLKMTKFTFEIEAEDIREAAQKLVRSLSPVLTDAPVYPTEKATKGKNVTKPADPSPTQQGDQIIPPDPAPPAEFNFLDPGTSEPAPELVAITKDQLTARLSAISTSGYQATLGGILGNRPLKNIPEAEYPTVLGNAQKTVKDIITQVKGFANLPPAIQKEFPELAS